MNKSYVYGAMALGLLFTGCSSDKLDEPTNNGPLEADQTFYISMNIRGDVPETRSSSSNGNPQESYVDNGENKSDFNDGTGQENKVSTAYFVFYDEDGNVVGDIVPIDLPDADETPVGNTVEKSYKEVVSVVVRSGEKLPKKVICYLNPINAGTLNVDLNTIQTVTRSEFSTGTGDNRTFAMSNSVYYPEGEAANSVPQVAVPIPPDLLFDNEDDANDALDAAKATLPDYSKCVQIYVERYATKLAFNAASPTAYETATRKYNDDGTYTVVPVTLSFTPQYWAVNAQANRNYVIKSFRQESETGVLLGDNYTYGTLNSIINKNGESILSNTQAWDWNFPDYHRSYWGMSPAYFTSEYPEVSSDIVGNDALEVNQKYISYGELATLGFAANNTTAQYFRETTVGSIALHSKNPAAAVASVIYVGQYGVSVNETAVTGNPGFYTYLSGPVTLDNGEEEYRPYVYFENLQNSTTSKVTGGESMLKRFLVAANILYKPVYQGSDIVDYARFDLSNEADLATLTNALEVDVISDEVKIAYDGDTETKLKLQANARTLRLKSVGAAEGIYVLTANGFNQVVTNPSGNNQISLIDANLAIMRLVGMAYYYTSGHAYFNIPVKHLGWYRGGNTQKGDNNIDWNKVRVGDFGMVRNHSYTINVTEISGLAEGIGGDDIPIVPPAGKNDYYIAYSVRVLKWAVVPTQDVKL